MVITYYVVLSAEGVEGCFPRRADAEGYMAELREIGVSGLRIDVRQVTEWEPE